MMTRLKEIASEKSADLLDDNGSDAQIEAA